MIWSGISRSSAIPRGQRDEFSPSSRTKRRGDDASALAGVHTTQTHASSPSSCFIVSSVASIEAAGPASRALRHIASALQLRKASPISPAASGPFVRVSTAARSAGAWSERSGQSSGANRASRRFQAPGVESGASLGRTLSQPVGKVSNGPLSPQSAARRRSRDCDRPRTTMSASAAAVWPSRVVTVRTPWTKCRSILASARRARK